MSSPQQATDYDDAQPEEQATESNLGGRLKHRASDGSLALLAGSVLLVGAVRSGGRTVRRLVQGGMGAAFIAIGIRQRSTDSSSAIPSEPDEGIAERFEKRARRQILGPNHESVSAPAGQEQHGTGEAQADEIHADPRQGENGTAKAGMESDSDADIDLSEAATAEEPGEAVGPSPEQAQPTETDGPETQPDPAEGVRMVGEETGEEGSVEGSGEGSEKGGEEGMDGTGEADDLSGANSEAADDRSYADPDEAADESKANLDESGHRSNAGESEAGDGGDSEAMAGSDDADGDETESADAAGDESEPLEDPNDRVKPDDSDEPT